MESPPKPSSVDTSRPFRSVKEAVAIFGERVLVGELYSPSKQETSISYSTKSSPTPSQTTITTTYQNDDDSKNIITASSNSAIFEALKKVEAGLEETKVELKLLKEREQETEVALASLNAELHKNMSKLAGAEAAAAAAAAARPVGVDEGRRRELVKRMEKKKTLAEILRVGEKQRCFGREMEMVMVKKNKKKEKPIVPIVWDLCFRKKESPTSTLLYSAPEFYH
ncbi:hypothetical protein UlMin_030503 [Ulmus minor]